jgi:hypothetical protein
MARFVVDDLEHRSDPRYDDKDTSRIWHPHATRMLPSDPELTAAIVWEVLALVAARRSASPLEMPRSA